LGEIVGQVSEFSTAEILKALPGAWEGLQQADRRWESLRHGSLPIPQVVQVADDAINSVEYDVAISGGTLGILIGAALAQRGLKVVLLERGRLQGRTQEWNISRRELGALIELELLTSAELDAVIASEFNPVRVGFEGGADIWVRDVLNIGVSPVRLLETLKHKFINAGGTLLEDVGFENVIVYTNGIAINQTITAKLLLDGMGHFSPIVAQARQGQPPDAVCLVVGTCATGFPANQSGDLIYSFTPIAHQCQYFWEAFPASDGRTTYLFTYIDAAADRFSLEFLFDQYFRLLPEYQLVKLDQLQFKRALYGFFPCYRDSPRSPTWDRILPIGDSSGLPSPLSFGGFGAMVRHLPRLTQGIQQALRADALNHHQLAKLLPYQPNLAVTWLFQKSMSVGLNQTARPDQINQLLVNVFAQMQGLGDDVLLPFLQDVVQCWPLTQTLAKTTIVHPTLIFKLIPQVGLLALIDWAGHFVRLAGFTLLARWGKQLQPWVNQLPPDQQYDWQCRLDAWKYGSGGDYHPSPDREPDR
jgi:lycopene cyclase CruP